VDRVRVIKNLIASPDTNRTGRKDFGTIDEALKSFGFPVVYVPANRSRGAGPSGRSQTATTCRSRQPTIEFRASSPGRKSAPVPALPPLLQLHRHARTSRIESSRRRARL